ncbi:MAG: VOC family protein [Pirellulales bacterium]
MRELVVTQSDCRFLDSIHHVAIQVDDVDKSVEWYQQMFQCDVTYRDGTWALLDFANVRLALVSHDEHPPHIGLVSSQAGVSGGLTLHRDGTKSRYVNDPSGNSVELLEPKSVDAV